MTDLATWIEQNAYELIIAASETLSQNSLLQSHAAEAVAAFYDALLRSARTFDSTPLYTILMDWVDTQSSPTASESPSLVPLIAQLKASTGQQIFLLAQPEEAAALYYAADTIFTDALVFMASVEAEDMLITAHEQQKQAQETIDRLNKSKSDFIAIAAHELKTPLTVIEGYVGMLPMLAGASDEMLPMITNGIEGGARRLREIVEDLVDVSLIDLEALELHVQPVWLHQIIDALERSVIDFVLQRGQNFYVDREALPRQPITADPERLLQAFNKVVSNAIKYTPDGGQITIGARRLQGFVDIMIADTGVGIESSRLSTLFNPFSSGSEVALHSSGKVKFMGAGPGLGLAIARGIIEAHGGSIWAESPGYNEQTCPGSTFHLLIPLQPGTVMDAPR